MHKKFSDKVHDMYYRIGTLTCPAFPGETIYFNKHGFNHLLRKNRKYRSPQEQRRRFQLLSFVVDILKNSNHIDSVRISTLSNSIARFWTIKALRKDNERNTVIYVVLRKCNDGLLHFFSVYDSRIK